MICKCKNCDGEWFIQVSQLTLKGDTPTPIAQKLVCSRCGERHEVYELKAYNEVQDERT